MLKINPPFIAHRGASIEAPENTMAAFSAAAKQEIRWLEFDVMLSSDNVPVVFHDIYLDRTTNGKGRLADYPYAYLRTLDAGSWFHPRFAGEHIPSLEEVLIFLRNMHVSANIEVKPLPGHEDEAVQCIMDVVKHYFPQPDPGIIFSSFSLDVLQSIRKYSPECHLGLLLHTWHPEWQSLAESLACVSIHVNDRELTEAWASQIKSENKLLLVYTVNDPIRAEELFSWGVDAVFSDAPDQCSLLHANNQNQQIEVIHGQSKLG